MITGSKTLIPLIAGAVLLIGGLVGAGLALLRPPPARKAAEVRPAPPERLDLAATWKKEKQEREEQAELSAQEQEKLDKDEIKQIILAQIRATPEDVDAAWFAEVFQFIPSEEAFREFLDEALARGVVYDATYTAEYRALNPRKAQPSSPGYYTFEARKYIYGASPEEKRLVGTASGLLDMALNREYLANDGWEGVRSGFLTNYFASKQRLYEELRKLATAGGGEPMAWWEDIVRIHEATVLHRFIMLRENRDAARRKLKDTGSSGKRASFDVRQQQATMNQHLLALGRFYLEAAMAETTYLGKQRQYNERAFSILAMVYQRKPSGEALNILTKANAIQRNQLWRMGKAHWKRASRAAAAGDSALAHEQYLQAKRRYLQSLSRVETSKKKKLYNEYATLQQEINAWKQAARGETDTDTTSSG